MVTVPRRQEERLAEAPLPAGPGVAPTPRIGEGEAELFQQARANLAEAEQRFAEERKKAQVTNLSELRAQLTDAQTQVMRETRKRTLGEAEGADTDAINDFTGRFEDIDAGIKDPAVREALRREFLKQRVSLNRDSVLYVDGQLRQHASNVTSSEIKGLIENSLMLVDPKRDPPILTEFIVENIEKGVGILEDEADRLGLDQASLDRNIAGFKDEIHRQIITRLVTAKEDVLAKEWLEEFETEMSGDTQTRMAVEVKRASIEGETLRLANEFNTTNPNFDLEDARKEWLKQEDPDMRRLLKRRLLEIKEENDAVLNEKVENMFVRISRQQDVFGPAGEIWRDFILSDQRDEMASLPLKERLLLEKLLDRRGKTNVKLNNRAWMRYVVDIRSDPIAFAKMSELELEEQVLTNMDQGHRERVISEWTRAQQAVKAAEAKNAQPLEEFKSSFTRDELIVQALADAGIDGFEAGDTMASIKGQDNEDKARAFREWQERVEVRRGIFFAENRGKNPNDVEEQQIIDRLILPKMLLEIEIPGAWNPTKALEDMTADELNQVIPDFTKVPRRAVENMLLAARNDKPPILLDPASEEGRIRITRAFFLATATRGKTRLNDPAIKPLIMGILRGRR